MLWNKLFLICKTFAVQNVINDIFRINDKEIYCNGKGFDKFYVSRTVDKGENLATTEIHWI